MQEGGPDNQTNRNADHFGALIHHLSLIRNKRCLLAYVYNRAEVIRNLGRAVERVLPEEIEEKLSNSEKDYFKNHSATLQSYMSELDLDLAVDMVPPKDPCIKVRVLDEIGNVVLSDQLANLTRHAILFLRRTDAEPQTAHAGEFRRKKLINQNGDRDERRKRDFHSIQLSIQIYCFNNLSQGLMEELTS